MYGCDSEGATGDEDAAGEEAAGENEKETDAYDDYIRSALSAVNDETKDDEDVAVSSMENPDYTPDTFVTPTPFVTDDATPTPPLTDETTPSPPVTDELTPTPSVTDDMSPTPTDDPDGSPTPTPTPYITPDEFDVGKCCIYINGESDSAYGTEIITAINKARTDLGYSPLITNKGLTTCADRRTREIAANFDHTRPNGLPFYSLAPEHFKAEMLIINLQKAEDAVDTMIKRDPISRRLIFTDKYQSIGASSFKCNGAQYTVVSFGL